MNSTVSKIITVFFSLLLLTYISVQIFTAAYNPYETETVKQKTYSHSLELDGFFVKEEIVLDEQKKGVINYKYNNGEKIPKDAEIADIYNLESDLYNIKKIERLTQEKMVFESLNNSPNNEGSKINLFTEQVVLLQLELVRQIESGDLSLINDTKDKLTYYLNKIASSVDKSISFDKQISDIENEINNAQSKISATSTPVISHNSGYFSNQVDGYENFLTLDILEDLSVDFVEQQLADKSVNLENNIGKLQLEPDWYFVSLIDNKSIEKVKIGQTVSITFTSKTLKPIEMKIDNIITEKDKEESVLVLHSNYIDEDIMTMRFEKPIAVLGEFTGIVIPKEAIRVSDVPEVITDDKTKEAITTNTQVKGVYTLLGKTVRFKELDIIYEDNYVVISKQNEKSHYVSVYDKVIIKGKDMSEIEQY